MRIKRFQARSVAAALHAVKRELGSEAMILETRPLPPKPWRFWLGRSGVEVTAASGWSFSHLSTQQVEVPESELSVAHAPERSEQDVAHPSDSGAVSSLRPLLGRLLEHAEAVPPLPLFPAEVERIYDRLLQQGVEEGLARLCGMHLNDHPDASAIDYLASLLGRPEPIRRTVGHGGPRRVVLVGPTGVGKTTTLAKLAAEYALKRGWRVALIGADTYRMAATEQLARYAEIMNLPFRVARDPQELRLHVSALTEFDLVLIDTAGRSHRSTERMSELHDWLTHAGAHEAHLCISLTMPYREAIGVLRTYQRLGVDRLLLTKRDEVEGIGLALNLGVVSGLPLSYFTDGQRVPEDLRLADPSRIARELLGEEGEERV